MASRNQRKISRNWNGFIKQRKGKIWIKINSFKKWRRLIKIRKNLIEKATAGRHY